jgi:hypothetical protein
MARLQIELNTLDWFDTDKSLKLKKNQFCKGELDS